MTTDTLHIAPHLQSLDNELRDRFGPFHHHAWLCLLVALTGRTDHPVSARMVVSAVDVQDEIVAFITEQLGEERVAHFARVTEAGLLSLSSLIKNGLACLCLNGIPRDSYARDVLYRLIQHRPIRVLDGSPTGVPRDRGICKPVACLIVRGDACRDREVLNRMITLRFDENKETLDFQTRRRLAETGGTAPHSLSRNQFNPSLPPSRPLGLASVFAGIKQSADIDRIEAVLSLAAIWHRLQAGSGTDQANQAVLAADIEAVLHLLESAKAPADQATLSRPAADCLHVLQRHRDDSLNGHGPFGAKHEVQKRHRADSRGPFTCQGFLKFGDFRSCTEDSVRLWFKELENAGLLEERAKEGRRKSYDLTEAGLSWKSGLLASQLRVLLSPMLCAAKPENRSLGLHSPTVGDVVSDSSESDAFQPPPI